MNIDRLQELEDKARDQESFEAYYVQSTKCVTKIVDWIDHTERQLAKLLKGFLELAHTKIQKDGLYAVPKYLACEFSISDRLDVDIGSGYDHEKVFPGASP